MKIVGKTDIGLVRDSNQDSYTIKNLDNGVSFAVLCDGMGGHSGGKVAGQLACLAASDYIEEYCADFGVPENINALLHEAVAKANGVVFSQSLKSEEYKGMGTTIVVFFVYKNRARVCHVGDSRLYLYRNGELSQITKDHSVVQELLDRGEIEESDIAAHPLKNVITKAVGVPERLEGDIVAFDILPDDTVLLCSDGLSSYVDEKNVAETIKLYGVTEECCGQLITLANEAGGKDNVTVVLCGKES